MSLSRRGLRSRQKRCRCAGASTNSTVADSDFGQRGWLDHDKRIIDERWREKPMQERPSYLIIGNGIAGVTAAEILRAEDSAADITVVADDPFPVYYRPALKDYLAGRVREDKLWARPTSFYQDQRIRFLSKRVVGIQVGQHSVQLQSGRQVGYSRLLLANGARPSTLKCPGLDLAGVTTLRTIADYQAVQNRLSNARRVVVTGSGTLALET